MKRLATTVVMLATLLACAQPLEEHERPVVRIDGRPLSRAEIETHLTVNLANVDQVEVGTAQIDLVRSRLLDAWVDERLMLAEATERHLTLADEHLDPLLDDPEYETGEEVDRSTRRTHLRERLMIEMLQGQVLQDIVRPPVEAATEWLAERPEAHVEGKKVELRSLRFDDATRALSVHRSLRGNRFTFNEAVLQVTEDESQGMPTVVEWDTLPQEVRGAIEKLRRGWSSKPVEVGGSTYLFQVVRWIEADPDARIEAARDEMYNTERRAVWESFVDGLRERAEIEIIHENLPFAYVSGSPEPGGR